MWSPGLRPLDPLEHLDVEEDFPHGRPEEGDQFDYRNVFGEDDTDVAEDRWFVDRGEGHLYRIHSVARRHLFAPTEIGLPFPLNQLRNERRTVLTNYRGVRVIIDDDWRGVGSINVGYGEWVGHTVFTMQGFPTLAERFYHRQTDDEESDGTNPGEDPDEEDLESSEEEPVPKAMPRAGGADGTSRYHSPSPQARDSAKDYIQEVLTNFENTERGWAQVIGKGNALVRAAGSVRAAAESLWEVREELGLMNLQGVDDKSLDQVLHPDLLAYLRGVRTEGMPARYVGQRQRVCAKLHPNAKRNVGQVYQQIAKDLKKLRVLAVDSKLEELRSTVSSPFEAVDKMLPDRSISEDKRVVHDQRTVNKGSSKWWHPPALQPTHAQVARRIVRAKLLCPGLPILLSKKDISGAFRLLWVDPKDVELFAGDLPWVPEKAFKEKDTEVDRPVEEDVTVLYLVSSFGFSGSPGEWTMWGRATEELHRAYKPAQPRRDLRQGFDSKVLVDDCVLVEPWVGLRPWVSAEVFEEGVKLLLGEKAVNKEKDELEGAFRTSQTIWGIIMETDTEKAMLPERRVQKGAVLMSEVGFDYGEKSLTLKQLQQFRGILTGWASIVPGLQNELKAADKFLGGIDGSALVQPKIRGEGSKSWETSQAWEDLWELFEICRWLAAKTDQWDLLFSTTLRRMLPASEQLALPGEWNEAVFISSDATTTHMAAIDWKNKKVFRETSLNMKAWIDRVLTDEERSGDSEELVIHLGEMLSFVAFACASGPSWEGRVIIYAGDNTIVRSWLQGRKSNVRGGRLLVRVVNMVEMRWGCHILAGWWRTYHNIDADYLTRCTDEEFDVFCKDKGFEVVDVKPYIKRALEDTGRFGPCFLYGSDDADHGVLAQLKERRVSRQIQKSLDIPWENIRVVEWAPQGRNVSDFISAAGAVGAMIEEGKEGVPTILAATLGVDCQGRQLCKVLETAVTAGAKLVIVEGPKSVNWELGLKKCEKKDWDCYLCDFLSTELGELMARRRRCLLASTNGPLPPDFEEGLVKMVSSVPVHYKLTSKPWEDLVWKTPVRTVLESGIPRERLLPLPVGHHFWSEDGERMVTYGTGGPCYWPRMAEDGSGVIPPVLFDRRGPPGALRELTFEEIWVLQGRRKEDLKESDQQKKVEDGCRATGQQVATNLLVWGGTILVKQAALEVAKAGMARDSEGAEAMAQILVWLRRWKRGDFGGPAYAGGCAEPEETEERKDCVFRWCEAWWFEIFEEESQTEFEGETYAGGRKPKLTEKEIAEKVAKTTVSSLGLAVRPFHGDVKDRIEEWLEENLTGDKSASTEKAYAGAWSKWCAWAKRQGWLSEYLSKGEDLVSRENKVLAFIGYLGWLGASVNTLRLHLFAIKNAHKRIGAGDVLNEMHRIWILIGGLDRRSTTRKPRRLGVTQQMLEWLGEHLVQPFENDKSNPSYGDAVTIFAALSTAWFFMLRAKEFAESNGVDLDMIVRGCDIRFTKDGKSASEDACEVSLTFRKTKVDQLAFGDTKTLQATYRRFLCPVQALKDMREIWPSRFLDGHPESLLPLFRWASGAVLKRLEIQHLLQQAASGVGLPADRIMSHSLRIGGATALYQATADIELVKRLGRWTSSAVHRYLEDGGEVRSSSKKMAKVKIDVKGWGVWGHLASATNVKGCQRPAGQTVQRMVCFAAKKGCKAAAH